MKQVKSKKQTKPSKVK